MSRAGRSGAGQPPAAAEPSAAELEAELLQLGAKPGGRRGRAPVSMEAIERMAALCMRDPGEEEEEEEEDEDLEGEEELLVGAEGSSFWGKFGPNWGFGAGSG
ncbi:coiled-coil and C2 domain-containing protein 1A-like [Phasianus colchicus]|uniref:coiled-coil and C2 domain-containing protein 1A-like n=1 Tax=Phasianus colchicus TaxID=9054 RepID=UPI00129DBD5C|nr:coiled-coil and C2 domain-containing protein 1A-like [Phasianus colchicus]